MIKGYSILQSLATRLANITTGNGYYTNAGNSVSQFYVHYDSVDDLPLLVITPSPDGDEVVSHSERSGKYKLSTEFMVEGHIQVTTTLEPAYQLGRDIIRAVLSDDLRIDNQAIDIVYSNQKITAADDGNGIATVTITFSVTYHEDLTQTGA